MARWVGWEASFCGEVVAEGSDESGGERGGGIILKEKAEVFAKLDDEAGTELARELDFNVAGIDAGQAAGWIGAWILGRLRSNHVYAELAFF